MNKLNNKKDINMKRFIIILVSIFLGVIIIGGITDYFSHSNNLNNEKVENEQEVKKENMKNRLNSLLTSELGSSNLYNNKNRLIELELFKSETVRDSLGINFLVNDNLNEKLIRGSAKTDIRRMMKIVIENYKQIDKFKNIDYILVRGSFPFNDKYGNENLETMLLAYFKVSKLEKVNWEKEFSYDLTQVAEYYKFEK